MRRLATAPNIAIASMWRDLLLQAGIEATVQRYFAGSIAGDLPPDQALPEIWISDDTQIERAQTALDAFRHPVERHWLCRACGERVEGPFDECWNCGAPMP